MKPLFKIVLRFGVIVIFLAYCMGCAAKGAFLYKPIVKPQEGFEFPAKLAVKSFEDKRGTYNKNFVLLYLIPLVPYGYMRYDQPEAGSMYLTHASYQIRPSEDLAKALVADIKNSGMFEEVFYTEREKPDAELAIEGTISSTNYDGKLITYCLSVYGPLLWFFGLPAGHATNTLALDVQLVSIKDGEVIWKNSYSKELKKTIGLYYNWGEEFSGYTKMTEEFNKQIVESIKKKLANKPKEFWDSLKK